MIATTTTLTTTTTYADPFITPPEEGGQIVSHSFALLHDRNRPVLVRLTYDAADGTRRFHVSTPLRNDAGDYWNGRPRNRRWRAVPVADVNRLMIENGYEPFED